MHGDAHRVRVSAEMDIDIGQLPMLEALIDSMPDNGIAVPPPKGKKKKFFQRATAAVLFSTRVASTEIHKHR